MTIYQDFELVNVYARGKFHNEDEAIINALYDKRFITLMNGYPTITDKGHAHVQERLTNDMPLSKLFTRLDPDLWLDIKEYWQKIG